MDFLSKSLTLDVQRKVEKLNSSIFQLFAQIADGTVFVESRPYSAELEKSYNDVAALLSPATAHLLFRTSHAEDYIWVQNGMQAALAELSGRIVATWDVEMTPTANSLLSAIHRKLFIEGETATRQAYMMTHKPFQSHKLSPHVGGVWLGVRCGR